MAHSGFSANRATIQDRQTGIAMLRVAGQSDPKRMHGAAPKLILADEPSSVAANTLIDRMLAALQTSTGEDSRLENDLAGNTGGHVRITLSRLAFNEVGYSPGTRCQSERLIPCFNRRTWLKANPGLDRLPDLEKVIRQEAAKAKANPAAMASFKVIAA